MELTQPKFRFTHTPIPLLKINIYPIHIPRIDLRSAEQADSNRQKVESGDTDTLVVRLREYERYRRQEHCYVVSRITGGEKDESKVN